MNNINDFEGEYFFMDESHQGKHLEENIRGHCRINCVSPLSPQMRSNLSFGSYFLYYSLKPLISNVVA
jgi:hypothetical protein